MKEITESVKEITRLLVFLVVSALITVALDKLSIAYNKDVLITVLVLVLRGLDKYIHENEDGFKGVNGLLPF